MMPLSQYLNERAVWLGVLAIIAIGYGTAPAYLRYVKSAVEAPYRSPRELEAEDEHRQLKHANEDDLKLDTLRQLYAGPSVPVQHSVVKILNLRCMNNDRVKAELFRHLASPEYSDRDKAIQAINVLLFHPATQIGKIIHHFLTEQSFNALIAALCNVSKIHPPFESEDGSIPPSPIRPPKRPVHEHDLLGILAFLLDHQIRSLDADQDALSNAVAAGIITKWLAHYPFPCAVYTTKTFRKSSVYSLLRGKGGWSDDDRSMSQVFKALSASQVALRQLRKVGLRPDPSGRLPDERKKAVAVHSKDDKGEGVDLPIFPLTRANTDVDGIFSTTEEDYTEWRQFVMYIASADPERITALVRGAAIVVHDMEEPVPPAAPDPDLIPRSPRPRHSVPRSRQNTPRRHPRRIENLSLEVPTMSPDPQDANLSPGSAEAATSSHATQPSDPDSSNRPSTPTAPSTPPALPSTPITHHPEPSSSSTHPTRSSSSSSDDSTIISAIARDRSPRPHTTAPREFTYHPSPRFADAFFYHFAHSHPTQVRFHGSGYVSIRRQLMHLVDESLTVARRAELEHFRGMTALSRTTTGLSLTGAGGVDDDNDNDNTAAEDVITSFWDVGNDSGELEAALAVAAANSSQGEDDPDRLGGVDSDWEAHLTDEERNELQQEIEVDEADLIPRDRSLREEEMLRRQRRREAVVVAEPGEPLGRLNILTRDRDRLD